MIEKENIVSLPGNCFGSDQNKALRLALGNLDSENIPYVVDNLQVSIYENTGVAN